MIRVLGDARPWAEVILGVLVPDHAFPHVNDGPTVRRGLALMNALAWALLLTPILVGLHAVAR